jgi:ABC-type multidrug transport system fused ATPase/permease subunit
VSTLRKLYRLLNPEQKRAGLTQFLLMLVGMVFETIGIGLLIPVLTLISKKNLAEEYPSLQPFLHRIGDPSQKQMVVGVMIILVLVYVLKMLFLTLLAWRQSRFIFSLQFFFSQTLFKGYLGQPYTFHLQRNSAQLIRNVTVIVSSMTSSLTALMTILTEFFAFFGILIFLLYLEPFGTVFVVSIFGVAAWIFQRMTRRRLLQWGNSFQFHEEKRILHLQQGLGGAKDVKLLGREDDFLNQYSIHNAGSARSGQRKETLQVLPRLWLELLAVMCMAILVLALVVQGRDFGKILPTLGIFAAAAFRLMPSVNRMMSAFQNVRYAEPAINALSEELSIINTGSAPAAAQAQMPFLEAITLNEVFFSYAGTEVNALNGVSISISKGSAVGFIGTSGAGKSTLVDTILGLLKPTHGSVMIDGTDIQANLRGWQNHIGYVSQSIFLTDDTLRRNIAFGLADDLIDEAAILRAIRSAQLEQFVETLPDGLNTVVGERGVRLSGGQRQRIGIARALYHNPPVLVLDEATSSLDSFTESGVMEAVKELRGSKTLIIVAHRLSTVEYCDYIYRIEKGKVTEAGKVAEVLRTERPN